MGENERLGTDAYDQLSTEWRGEQDRLLTVPEQTFNRAQAILSGRRPTVAPKLRNHPDFPLRGFVRCGGCGSPLTADWAKGRTTKLPYYRCNKTR